MVETAVSLDEMLERSRLGYAAQLAQADTDLAQLYTRLMADVDQCVIRWKFEHAYRAVPLVGFDAVVQVASSIVFNMIPKGETYTEEVTERAINEFTFCLLENFKTAKHLGHMRKHDA